MYDTRIDDNFGGGFTRKQGWGLTDASEGATHSTASLVLSWDPACTLGNELFIPPLSFYLLKTP